MKITIDVKGLDEVRAALKDLSQRRIHNAVATGLTRTALQARDAVRDELRSRLDRPTPYALNGLYVITATGDAAKAGMGSQPVPGSSYATRIVRSRHLEAEVGIKDDLATTGGGTPAERFLRPNIDGGARRIKRVERALQLSGLMPAGWQTTAGTDARLDAYGNVSRGQIVQVLSQLRVTLTAGYTRNMALPDRTAKGRIIDGRYSGQVRAAVKRAGGRYFVVPPGQRMPPGVYMREHHASGRPLQVLRFVKSTSYRPIVDFNGVVLRVADQHLRANVQTALADQLANLRTRGRGV
ncbi:hypothetical protein [Leptothrix discophora]|uniref:Minor tail protein n=1 Tax=Leptothrix discophora TaxID=89 RepID=A0ABT9G1R4_LEPDI|nr:hypothetical protein [Leptothrix discophora]MDP4300360.1 hypothetical protein [Leptothrix discophora]